MNATLGQSLTWNPIPGAHFDVRVVNFNNAAIVYHDALDVGSNSSILLSTLLAVVDLTTATHFNVFVRSKLPGGALPSSWSSALDLQIVGFGVPTGLSVS